MHNENKNVFQKIAMSLETTAIALIILSIIALFYNGTMICISAVFEIFGICLVIQVALWVFEKIEIENLIIDIILQYTIVIMIVISGGILFHWIDYISIWLIVSMAIICNFLVCRIEMRRIKIEIDKINHLVEKKREYYEGI